VEWKTDARLSPEAAFSHPFIAKAVNELKCLRQGASGTAEAKPGSRAQENEVRAGAGASA